MPKKKGGSQPKQLKTGSGLNSPTKVKDDSDSVPSSPSTPFSGRKNQVNLNENESWFTTFRIQVATLMWKNWVIFTRKMQILAFAVLTPPIVIWMMLLLQGVGDNLEEFGHADSEIHDVQTLNLCESGSEVTLSDWVSKSFVFFIYHGMHDHKDDISQIIN